MIPYGRHDINQNDIDAVVNVLTSDRLTQGPIVPKFEQALAELCQASYAVAANSATSSLHLACLSLEVSKGDIVWTSPISFVASANCALYCGADIDFIDVDPATANISIAALTSKLHNAKKLNKLPKVIIPVHLAGLSCDMEAIYNLSKEFNFKIIEDASHAVGATYKNLPVGSCKYSDITVFSFHPVKIITSAEGGMALTNSAILATKMSQYRSHGITACQHELTSPSHGPWYYEQQALGFNYRMTDLQGALGLSQLDRLSFFIDKRHELAKKYDVAFEEENLAPLIQSDDCHSSYHLYVLLLPEKLQHIHRELFEHLREQNIFSQVHYIPIHLQPFYADLGFKTGDFPAAENYYQRAISLPLHPNLSDTEQQFIIKTVIEFVKSKN